MKEGIIQDALLGLLPETQSLTLQRFFASLVEIMSETIDINELPKLKLRIYEAMAYLERDFPLALMVFS